MSPTKIIKSWGFGVLEAWNHICNPVTETFGFDLQIQITMLKFMYYYNLIKILDLLDTVFFVLRKKQSLVTFLHLFHHSSMILSTWITVVYLREQVGSLLGILNIIVHVIMYSYYFLSSFGPSMQQYLWWKKRLTRIQMISKVIIIWFLSGLIQVVFKSLFESNYTIKIVL